MSEYRIVVCRVRMSPAEKTEVDAAAARAGQTFSAYVREALELRQLLERYVLTRTTRKP